MRSFVLGLLASALFAPLAAAQTIDRIRDTGVMTIGFRADADPLSYADAQGLAAGYTPRICAALARAIASELSIDGLRVSFVSVGASDRFDKVASGEIDLLCGAATITLSRRELVDFSIPVYVDGAAVALPAGAGTDLADLAGKSVGVHGNTTTEQALRNSLEKAGVEATVVTFDDHNSGFAALLAGEVDGYFADQSILVGLFVRNEVGAGFNISDNILTIEKQGLALARGDTEFRLLVDRILSVFYANGTMRQTFETALPGVRPGAAMRALYLIAPELP
ncbi:MAG TPA: amino acid ABC transporter substrate-binding protein [Rhodobacteraceae bacterium]|mgnify:FL=1|jgi:polar amino acid transport system substrate-binding protein|nr:amino acid ABC transporter substrate-binding protein [Paracoccaceae bacterium]HBG99645.1 amino acid ABC transporter substrate-binding protein [Paracoccaceae bacterium]